MQNLFKCIQKSAQSNIDMVVDWFTQLILPLAGCPWFKAYR